MIRRVLLTSIILCLFISSDILSKGNIQFTRLTVEDGLSQSSVTCILQDRKGFMWFGTQDGLNRYDGYRFKIFKNDPSDSTSLTDNFIFSIIEDSSAVLYIETRNGIFHKYHPTRESFQVVNGDEIDFLGAKVNTVGAILREPSGIQWTGGLGSETGLKRTDIRTGQTTVFRHDPTDPFSISNDKVYSIFRDRSGILWIGTFNGLDKFDELTGKFHHYRNDPRNPQSLPDNWVWPIFEDSRGNLWIGTVNAGLCLFDAGSNTFINYKNDPVDPTSINDNFIFSIYEDRGGLIWVGTNLGGMSYFNPSVRIFDHFSHDPENPNSLSDNTVLSMLVDRNGSYWIGTRNRGLNKLDYSNRRFTHYSHNPSNSNSLLSNSIQSLLEDQSGIIWIGHYSSGLDAYDPVSGIFTHYIHDPFDPGTISDNRIYSLVEDPDSSLWIGTYGGGLNKLNKKTGKITRYQHDENDSTTISSNATWSLAFDDTDKLWIGTFGGGVNVLDKNTGTVYHFKNIPGDSTSIIDNSIIRVFKDSKANMWFGTTKGLSTYLWESKNFKNYDEKDGLANSFVYGIVEDANGNLWLSTNNGLSRFDPLKEIFRNYYNKDGLQGNEFNQNAFANDRKTGNLLFGGLNGFNIFHPDSLKDNTYSPPISFTGFIRYNTEDEEGKPIIEEGISERDTIFLAYKDNIITLEFAALSFYNNSKNQYRYKLEGFNDNWIQLGTAHSVTFTNLSPGEYELRVIGSNNDGVWNETGTSLMIMVSPPWWKTTIAYIVYFLVFFGVLYGLRRFEIKRREEKAQVRESALRIKATEAEKRALEIENERKTKELEEARQLQLSMLPKELPSVKDLEIGVFIKTATEVGGDYYDFLMEEDDVINIAMGDATGHGMQAGTMVTLMKGIFTSKLSKIDVNTFFSRSNHLIRKIKLGKLLMAFSLLQIDRTKLIFSSAGMPPLYLYRHRSGEVQEVNLGGMPFGAMKNFPYDVREMNFEPDDLILMLSDGLPELLNEQDEMFGYDRLVDLLKKLSDQSAENIIKGLVGAGEIWRNSRVQQDDITLMVIKNKFKELN